jgi:hypothetical protein
MYSILSFGKKRRTRRKVSRKGSKKSKCAKPPSRLLRICKKYKIKSTMKRGSKRVYKSIAVLKKACIKKVKAAMKADKKKKKSSMRRRKSSFGAPKKHPRSMAFGKRRAGGRGRKVSKAAAMKAFRQFYKRHCAGGRGSRFGNGGNPALSASMGYQFCPNGMGGVLGANSTGMFPSPCTPMAAPAAPMAFGRRRSKRKACKVTRRRKSRKSRKSTRKVCRKTRRKTRRKVCRKSRRKTRKVCRKTRRKTRKVTRRRRRAPMFGRRRAAFGLRRI